MILRPLDNFSTNGVLVGTIVALDDSGDPLDWEEYGNWSRGEFKEQAARRLAEQVGISKDKARSLVWGAAREARRAAGIPDPSQQPQEPEHDRPSIITSSRYVREVIDDSWRVLTAQIDPPVYYRMGDSLVALERDAGGLHTQVLRREALAARLDRLADYIRVDNNNDQQPAHPTRTVVEEMLAMLPPDLPVLQGISSTPILAPDGRCLTATGYYSEQGVYLDLEGQTVPPVPEAPDGNDVAEARRLLLEDLLGDFPWAKDADRANAVTPLLEPVLRHHIDGPMPLHMIEAPTEGTGKGLYSQVVAQVTTGSYPAAMAEARNDEEWRKRITSTLQRLPSLVLLDNLRLPLESGALASALTSRVWEDRMLGSTRNIRLPVTCTWLATANNPTMSAEIARRILRSRMDSGQARPWERGGWRHDPLDAWAKANRGRLLWALLVLARAWYAAGRPKADLRMGSFESWAGVMGGVLETAGIPGLLDNRHEVYQQTTRDAEAWEQLVAAWWESFGQKPVGVDQLHRLAREQDLMLELRAGRNDHGARILLGRGLSRLRDRRVGDWYVRVGGQVHGSGTAYRLDVERDPRGESPYSPYSPESAMRGGEYGEYGEYKTGPLGASGDAGNVCRSCQGTTPTAEIHSYFVDGGVLCSSCASPDKE